MVKFVSPVVYGAVLLPVVVLSVWATSFLTSHVFIRPDFYEGAVWPLIVTLPGAVVGAVVFAGVGRITLAFERLAHPTVLDHIRRGVLLYAVLVFLVVWVAVSYSPTGSNYAFAFQLQALSVVCSAIIIDALVLFSKCRTNTNSPNNAGGET